MTMKNGKTILFASLIVAMILPFSGMQFATAESESEQVQKITQSIQELKEKRDNTDNGVKKVRLGDTIQALKTLREIEILKFRGLENTDISNKLKLELQELLEEKSTQIQSKPMNPESFNLLPLEEGNGWRYDTFVTGLQVTQSCGETVTGQAQGSLTQYESTSYLYVSTDYPSVLHCDKIHEDNLVNVYDLSGMLTRCQVTIPYANGGAYVTCEDFGLLDDALTYNTIVITSNAFYDNGWYDTPFTAYNGIGSIVYHTQP